MHRTNSFFTGVDVTQANGVYLEYGGKKCGDNRRCDKGLDQGSAGFTTGETGESHPSRNCSRVCAFAYNI